MLFLFQMVYRNVIFVSGAVGLVIFFLFFPVAPPRFPDGFLRGHRSGLFGSHTDRSGSWEYPFGCGVPAGDGATALRGKRVR